MSDDEKEKRAEYMKQWREENPNYNKNYYINNKIKENQRSKKYREDNPEKIKNLWTDWYSMNKVRSIRRRFTESKVKAKKREINWLLTFEEYEQIVIRPCHYCNNELGNPVTRMCGLDRLDSNGHYELHNVVSCCYTCNTMKNCFLTPEETKVAADAIINYRKQNKLLPQ